MAKRMKDTLVIERSEGQSEGYEHRESYDRQKQTAVAPVVNTQEKLRAVTGVLHQIKMQVEGTDGSPEKRESVNHLSDETAPMSPMAEAKAKAAATVIKKSEKPRILIVEDTMELSEVIEATLEGAGMDTEAVSRGSKGLDRIRENTPDILLLDIGLPDMTGWKMLEELHEWKQNDNNNDMPTVVVITAYGDPANRLIGKLQGIHSYLIKPFTPDEVEKVVLRALADKVK